MKQGIGALRYSVTLENPTRTAGDGGTGTDTYEALGDLWAGIEVMSINGRFQNYAQSVVVSHVVKVRKNDDIQVGVSRFDWDGRKLYVRAEMRCDEPSFRLLACEEAQ